MLILFPRIKCLVFAVTLVVTGLSHVVSAAEPIYPVKPVRFIVTFSAGGGTDIFARAIAQKLTESWGQPVVVDNRAGAGGNLGTDMVVRAPNDGYTIALTTNAPVVINPNLIKVPYDPQKDFSPVSQVATLPFVLLVHQSVRTHTILELIALAREKGGRVTFASSGFGGGAHLSGELMKKTAKIDMTHVPYKGSAPALVALVGGQVDFMFVSILTATSFIQSNKLRPLAVTSLKRSPSLPNVPAMAETPGFDGFETDLWYGMLAPAKVSATIVNKIYADTRQALLRQDMRSRFEPTGTMIVASSPSKFAQTIKSDLVKWADVIKSSNLQPEN